MNAQYIALTITAAFWSGQFSPVDAPGAERLGFQIGHGDVSLGAHDPEFNWTALLLLGRGAILAITSDGTAVEVDLQGVLLGERHHHVVTAVSVDGFTVGMEAAQ